MLALGKSEIHLLNKYRPHKVRNVLIETTRLSGEKITPHTPTWYVNNLMYDPSHDVALSFWRQNQQHKTAEVHDLLPSAVDCVVIFCSLGGNRANEKDEYAFAHRQCLQCVECGVPIVWVLCAAEETIIKTNSPEKMHTDMKRWFPSTYVARDEDVAIFSFLESTYLDLRNSSPIKIWEHVFSLRAGWVVELYWVLKPENITAFYNNYYQPIAFYCKEAFEKPQSRDNMFRTFCDRYNIDPVKQEGLEESFQYSRLGFISLYAKAFPWKDVFVDVISIVCAKFRETHSLTAYDVITSTTDGATVLSVPSSYGAPLDRCLPYITYGYHRPLAGTTSYQVLRNLPCPHTQRLPHGTIRTTEVCYTILDELVPNSKVHRKEDMATPPPTSLTTKRQQSVRNKFIDLDEATVRLSTDTAPPTSTTHGRRASLIPVKSEDINPSTLFVIEDALTTEECDRLISQTSGYVEDVSGIFPNTYRRADRALLRSHMLAKDIFDRVAPHLCREDIYHRTPMCFGHEGVWFPASCNECIKLSRYDRGGLFTDHRDGPWIPREDHASMYTVVMYLNDDFEGGETVFTLNHDVRSVVGAPRTCKREEVTVQPKRGSIVVFNHELQHRGNVVLSGTKYIMRTELIFRRHYCLSSDFNPSNYVSDDEYLRMKALYHEAERCAVEGRTHEFVEKYQRVVEMQMAARDRTMDRRSTLRRPLERLNDDAFRGVAVHLADVDIVCLMKTCRRMYYDVVQSGVWEDRTKIRFPSIWSVRSLSSTTRDWFAIYTTQVFSCSQKLFGVICVTPYRLHVPETTPKSKVVNVVGRRFVSQPLFQHQEAYSHYHEPDVERFDYSSKGSVYLEAMVTDKCEVAWYPLALQLSKHNLHFLAVVGYPLWSQTQITNAVRTLLEVAPCDAVGVVPTATCAAAWFLSAHYGTTVAYTSAIDANKSCTSVLVVHWMYAAKTLCVSMVDLLTLDMTGEQKTFTFGGDDVLTSLVTRLSNFGGKGSDDGPSIILVVVDEPATPDFAFPVSTLEHASCFVVPC
eukprot:PhF_6_TR31847/c0_g1_i13/m.47185